MERLRSDETQAESDLLRGLVISTWRNSQPFTSADAELSTDSIGGETDADSIGGEIDEQLVSMYADANLRTASIGGEIDEQPDRIAPAPPPSKLWSDASSNGKSPNDGTRGSKHQLDKNEYNNIWNNVTKKIYNDTYEATYDEPYNATNLWNLNENGTIVANELF